MFGFLVNASAFPPEPRLVHERPMRRVHQSDNPVINVRRQLAGKMHDLVFVAENGKPGAPGIVSGNFDPAHSCKPKRNRRVLHRENAQQKCAPLSTCPDSKRRNLNALPAASIKPPPVITTLHHVPIQPPIRQRYPRCGQESASQTLSPRRFCEHQRHFQQHRRHEPLPANLRAPHRRIQKSTKSRIRLSRSFLRYLGIHPHHRPYRFAHDRFAARFCRAAF